MSRTTAPIGIAHLTLLRLAPPELVTVAAAAGDDFVGIRVKADNDGERQYPMEPGSPMSKETLRRLDDTGLTVRDVEILTLRPDTGPDDWLRSGAARGRVLTGAPHPVRASARRPCWRIAGGAGAPVGRGVRSRCACDDVGGVRRAGARRLRCRTRSKVLHGLCASARPSCGRPPSAASPASCACARPPRRCARSPLAHGLRAGA